MCRSSCVAALGRRWSPEVVASSLKYPTRTETLPNSTSNTFQGGAASTWEPFGHQRFFSRDSKPPKLLYFSRWHWPLQRDARSTSSVSFSGSPYGGVWTQLVGSKSAKGQITTHSCYPKSNETKKKKRIVTCNILGCSLTAMWLWTSSSWALLGTDTFLQRKLTHVRQWKVLLCVTLRVSLVRGLSGIFSQTNATF